LDALIRLIQIGQRTEATEGDDVMTAQCSVEQAPTGEGGSTDRRASSIAGQRTVISVIAHAFLFALALLLAFGLAYNFHNVFPSSRYSVADAEVYRFGGWLLYMYLPLLALALPLKLLAFAACRQYRRSWRCVGLRDLIGVASASWVGSFMLLVAYFGIAAARPDLVDGMLDKAGPGLGFRQGAVFVSDFICTVSLVAGAQVLWCLWHEETRQGPSGPDRIA